MDESALDLDSLTGLIRSILERMEPEELSEISSLLETGKVQHMILEMLGARERDSNPDELGSITAMLEKALQQALEEDSTR